MVCYVLPGNVYPVTEAPVTTIFGREQVNADGFMGRPHRRGYQSHYTMVKKKVELKKAYPITDLIDEQAADELVVFEAAQVLPLFLIYL